ncbi:hypothetical protein EGM97_03360 [Pseudomonas sp. AF32]|nr:hypothetical protein [Pseudomonas sp. AF32]
MGASLLAIAVYQAPVMVNLMPPSRASSLPQGVGSVEIHRIHIQRPAHRPTTGHLFQHQQPGTQ